MKRKHNGFGRSANRTLCGVCMSQVCRHHDLIHCEPACSARSSWRQPRAFLSFRILAPSRVQTSLAIPIPTMVGIAKLSLALSNFRRAGL